MQPYCGWGPGRKSRAAAPAALHAYPPRLGVPRGAVVACVGQQPWCSCTVYSALGGARSAVPHSLQLGVTALAVGAVPPRGSIRERPCSACEETGVCNALLLLTFPKPGILAGWRRIRCRGFISFPAVFVESRGNTDGFVNIPAKGYDVMFVQYQRIYFAAVFQDKSNKACFRSVTHTILSGGSVLVTYGFMGLYRRTNI